MGILEIWGGEPDPDLLQRALRRLGNPFELTASGLALKQYPCCAGSHPALDAILILRNRARKRIEELERIVLRVHPLVPRMMIHDRPATPLEAKFSLRACAAAAMLDGEINLATFTPESLLRSELTRWMDRIEIRPDLEEGMGEGQIPTRAEVTFLWPEGDVDQHRVEMPLGNPQNPLPDDAVRRKFEECALPVLPRRRLQELVGLLESLEEVDDFREITRRLRAPKSRRTCCDAR
jgi:2-methylcitrate dehydratase PrpD